jgi:hypothetical protein
MALSITLLLRSVRPMLLVCRSETATAWDGWEAHVEQQNRSIDDGVVCDSITN